jgi:curved DNA-binding protein CbpA
MADLYEVLQVHPKAEPDVIRAAYRALAHKYHPDNGGSQARMAALNDAWQVLGDPKRRATYDVTRAVDRSTSTPESSMSGANGRSGGARQQPSHVQGVRPSGSVLDFGRYEGWSLGELVVHHPEYLEWLERMPIGRRYFDEIEALLGPGRAARDESELKRSTAARGRGRRR